MSQVSAVSVVDPLQQRISSGFCGRCAALVAGRGASEQLLLLASQQGQSNASAGASPALKQLELELEFMRQLSRQDWAGVWMVLANIVILIMLRTVLRKAAYMGLLDGPAVDQPMSLVAVTSHSIASTFQPEQPVKQQQQPEEPQQQQQQQQQPEHDQVMEPPAVQALKVVPYTDISQRLSRAWLVLQGAAPRSALQGDGDVRWDLGEGSFAKVYAASYIGQLVVVKELKGVDSSRKLGCVSTAEKDWHHKQGMAALQKEAAMMEASRHSSVVQCIAMCKEPPALVLEWCYGGNLLRPTPRLLASGSAVDVVKLLHEAAAAVAYLHSQQRPCGRSLVHGDLRACNVLLKNRGGPDWGVKVADFGLAEWLQHDGRIEVQLVTNRCWVAPEVLEHRFGPYTISRASEVYMFGILMYETLTGKLPYEDQLEALCLDREEARRAEVLPFYGNLYEEFGVLQLPATLRFNFSPAVQSQLRDLYQRCTSEKPQARPSMLEVVQQLDNMIKLLVAEGG